MDVYAIVNEKNRAEEGIALLREGFSAVRVTGMYQYRRPI